MRHHLFAVPAIIVLSGAVGVVGLTLDRDAPVPAVSGDVAARVPMIGREAATSRTRRRRHVARLSEVATAASPATAQPADDVTTGQLYFTDLSADLYLTIDGEPKGNRRHTLEPGPHSVLLLHRDREIGRLQVDVPRGGITRVATADFRVNSECVARSAHERLLPEHVFRGCYKMSISTDFAMVWVARHQAANGFWSASGFQDACRGRRCEGARPDVGDVEVTALTLLSYLGAGETHNVGVFKGATKSGLRALKTIQDNDGRLAKKPDRRGHALAALAMTEAFGVTGSRLWWAPAQRALDVVLAADPAGDAEIAALEACLLASAVNAELQIPDSANLLPSRLRHLEGFGLPGTSVPRVTALLLAARALLDEEPTQNATLASGTRALTSHLSRLYEVGLGDTIDPLTTYFLTIAACQVGGPTWKEWNATVKRLVVDSQEAGGSWAPASDSASGGLRSRLTTTVFNILTLEVNYRYRRVFGASDG